MATATEPFGWSLFFSELSGFLRSADRQYGIANEQFSEYVVDRLERAIQSVSNFIDLMDTAQNQTCQVTRIRRVTHAFAVKLKLTRTPASISSYSNIRPLSFLAYHYSDS